MAVPCVGQPSEGCPVSLAHLPSRGSTLLGPGTRGAPFLGPGPSPPSRPAAVRGRPVSQHVGSLCPPLLPPSSTSKERAMTLGHLQSPGRSPYSRSTGQHPRCICRLTPLPRTLTRPRPGDEDTPVEGHCSADLTALPSHSLGGAAALWRRRTGCRRPRGSRGGKRWPLCQGSGTWRGGRDVDRLQRQMKAREGRGSGSGSGWPQVPCSLGWAMAPFTEGGPGFREETLSLGHVGLEETPG